MKADRSRRTPVLIGFGTATQRLDDPRDAAEPIELMISAARAAGVDAGHAAALSGVERILVPRGRWRYGDPGREIADRVCAGHPTTVLAKVGVLQQSLIADACLRIAEGEIEQALVVGGEAGHRLQRSRHLGIPAPDRALDGKPDILLTAREELAHPAELQAGLKMPVDFYAVLESAVRAKHGLSISDHARGLAGLYSRFSEIAAANPHAWSHKVLRPEDILEVSARNPIEAAPYSRRHCASWSVDQAAAQLLCSESKALTLGLDRSRWVYPWASTESNLMQPISARDDLAACPGARVAGLAALEMGQLSPDDVDLVELYSCFPVAVRLFADELKLASDRDLTITGGMAFAGGPFNNYVLQATCRAAELLRARAGSTALLSSVSGVLTKQAFGLWASAPPKAGFGFKDVTGQVMRLATAREVLGDHQGKAIIVGSTVLYPRDTAHRSIVVAETEDGRRAVAASDDPTVARMIAEIETCRTTIDLDGGTFALPA